MLFFNFPHYKSIENLSCHGNQIKKIIFIKKNKKQEMLQYVTNAPEGPFDTPSHYALSFCDVSLNLLQ